MTRTPDVSRLDRIIAELQVLHDHAQDIIDAHVDSLHHQFPGVPFGVLKSREIAQPAGNSLHYISAENCAQETHR